MESKQRTFMAFTHEEYPGGGQGMKHLHEELADTMNVLLNAHDKQIDAATAGQWVPLNMGEPKGLGVFVTPNGQISDPSPYKVVGTVNTGSSEAARRKECPIATGVLDYFPLALQEIARVSLAGNKQHHPDKPLHWDRTKSTDEADALIRHFLDRGTLDTDGLRHSAKMAWRSLALLQKELEQESK